MRVYCTISEVELEGEHGNMIPGVTAHCSRCDHETESYGTGVNSVRRCLVLLREECPNDETNFYIEE